MVDTKKLELRNQRKQKKYTFVVKESKFCAGVKRRWRFPRGKHSKVRQMHKGRPALPNPGYGSPKEVKGLLRNGLKPVVVSSVKELDSIDQKTEGAVLSRTLGKRRKAELLKLAQEKKITLVNVKDVSKSLDTINSMMSSRKKARTDRLLQKQKKEKEALKKSKKKDEKKSSDEEVKAKESQKSAESTPSETSKTSSKGKGKATKDTSEDEQKEIVNKNKN